MHGAIQAVTRRRESESAEVELRLLSGFELRADGAVLTLPMSSQRLLAFLALHHKPLHRLHVAGRLWIDASEERANANLRTAVWRVRQFGGALIHPTMSHLRLVDDVAVDVHDAEARAHRLIDAARPCDDQDLSDEGLSADLLPDWYDDWLLLEQERFRQLRLHALEALCERLTRLGRYAAAVEAGIAAVAGEPLRESAQRALVGAHLAEGNRGEALRQYQSYKTLLRNELSLDPSELLAGLVAGLEPAA